MAKREVVEAAVDTLLKRITGNKDLERDEDGDWPFALDRAVMYVRVWGDQDPTVSVLAIAAHDVRASPDLFELLNQVNSRLFFCRAMWVENQVLVATELVGISLGIEELGVALGRVADTADNLGPAVVEKCGGETPRAATQPPEPVKVPTEGYL
jgi:Putative bacterial sensory transduction regulator